MGVVKKIIVTPTPCECGDHYFAPATNAVVVLVSPCDEHLLHHKWSATVKFGRNITIRRHSPESSGHFLSRAIVRPARGKLVDHINGDGSDNRRSNLRECDHFGNSCNTRPQRQKAIPYKGVTRDRALFTARIQVLGKSIYLGSYKTPEEAHAAYCEAAPRYHGEFARVA